MLHHVASCNIVFYKVAFADCYVPFCLRMLQQ